MSRRQRLIEVIRSRSDVARSPGSVTRALTARPATPSPSSRAGHAHTARRVAGLRGAWAALAVAAAAGLAGCSPSPIPSPSPSDGPGTHNTAASYSPDTNVPAAPDASRPQVRGNVPVILVGTWSGGTEGETAGTSYTFSSDGQVQVRRYAATLNGVAVAEGNVLTFHFDGVEQPVTSRWAVTAGPEVYGYRYYNLNLDGYSYVRDA